MDFIGRKETGERHVDDGVERGRVLLVENEKYVKRSTYYRTRQIRLVTQKHM